jgi:uncharacterized surface protein with fasciclin (FAS1) repeats
MLDRKLVPTVVVLFGAALLALTASPARACDTCGCSDVAAAKPMTKSMDIVDTAVAAGSFKTLVAAVKAAGLVETLKGDGPFTVFAPSDEAFAKLPRGTVEALLADKAKLTAILTYHVVPGKLMAADVIGRTWLETAQGQSARISAGSDEVRIDDARIVATDVSASNGVIHVIDRVILPRKDIVDTAASAKTFKTLLAAAEAAGLVETLKSKGPFTVFAPTDDAFAKLPAGTVAALLRDKAKLAAILTYHVVPGRVLSTDLPLGDLSAKTAQGGKIDINRSDRGVTVNGARVLSADIIAGNGVIHVIDTVILPR